MATKLKFSDCTAELMQDTFGLTQASEDDRLAQWLAAAQPLALNEVERAVLAQLRKTFLKNSDTWNEIELIEYLIAPLFALIDFHTDYFKMFSERRIAAVVDDYELYGEPDTLIATGTYTPKTPYFCFNEDKRIEDAKGDALGQVLAEMLAAHTLNARNIPIYGVYVVDNVWYFLVLHDNAYCITKGHYAAHETDLGDIFKLLKALKAILIEIAKQEA